MAQCTVDLSDIFQPKTKRINCQIKTSILTILKEFLVKFNLARFAGELGVGVKVAAGPSGLG